MQCRWYTATMPTCRSCGKARTCHSLRSVSDITHPGLKCTIYTCQEAVNTLNTSSVPHLMATEAAHNSSSSTSSSRVCIQQPKKAWPDVFSKQSAPHACQTAKHPNSIMPPSTKAGCSVRVSSLISLSTPLHSTSASCPSDSDSAPCPLLRLSTSPLRLSTNC